MRELKIKNINWISIVRPKRSDLEDLAKNFPDISPLLIEELLKPTMRARTERYNGALFMVLHFLNFAKDESKKHLSHEIDFILLPDTLITIQYDNHNLLEKFWNENKDEHIEEQYGQTPAHFLYYFIRGYFHALSKELDHIQTKTDSVEEKIFSGKERETLKDVALLRKQLMDFRRTLGPQFTTLDSLSAHGFKIYGEEARHLLEDLAREYIKAWKLLETHKETLDMLYETNNSLLTLKTNVAVKNLTLVALMTFIPMAIAALFGMNVLGAPLARSANGFWIATSFIAIITFLAYLVLKWRKSV